MFLIILAPLVRTLVDYDTIEKQHRSINYLVHNTWTAGLILFQSVMMFFIGDIHTWYHVGWLNMISISFYWLTFDYALNWARGFRGVKIWSYYGDFSDKKNLSWIEENIYKEGKRWKLLMVVKVTLFVLTIVFYG